MASGLIRYSPLISFFFLLPRPSSLPPPPLNEDHLLEYQHLGKPHFNNRTIKERFELPLQKIGDDLTIMRI